MKLRIVIVAGCAVLIAVVLPMGHGTHGLGITGWIVLSCLALGIGCEVWEYFLDRADRRQDVEQDTTPATGIAVLTYHEDGEDR